MSGVNKVILVGHLGNDPECRALPSGNLITTISVATSRKFKASGGDMVEETEWHRCVAFGKTAEIMNEWLRKGSQVYLEGRLHTSSWETQQGEKRYKTEIVVENMQMVGGRQGEPRQDRQARQVPKPAQPAETFEFSDEDVPF